MFLLKFIGHRDRWHTSCRRCRASECWTVTRSFTDSSKRRSTARPSSFSVRPTLSRCSGSNSARRSKSSMPFSSFKPEAETITITTTAATTTITDLFGTIPDSEPRKVNRHFCLSYVTILKKDTVCARDHYPYEVKNARREAQTQAGKWAQALNFW